MAKVYNMHRKDAPADAIYIGRGSSWGNPFVIGQHGTRAEVIRNYEAAINEEGKAFIREHLKGKDLVCFCKPQPCHGDVLLRIANEESPT